MKVLAILLLAALGTSMVMSPELVLAEVESDHPLKAAKEATKESVEYAAEAARHTGEGIRQTLSSATQIPSQAAEAVQHKAGQAAEAVKDGAEKVGLKRSKSEPGTQFQQWESGLQAAKDRAAAAKAAAEESSEKAKQSAEKANLEKMEKAAPSRSEIIKEKVSGAYDATGEAVEAAKDKAGQAAKTVKDSVVGTGEAAKDTAGYAAKTVKDSVVGTGETAKDTAGYAAETVKDTVVGTGELIRDGARSAYQTAGGAAAAAKESTGQTVDAAKDKAGQAAKAVKDSVVGTGETIEGGGRAAYQKTGEAASAAKETSGSTVDVAKEKAGQAAKAVKDGVAGTGEWIQDSARAAYQRTGETASAAKDRVSGAASYGQDKTSESGGFVSDLAYRIAQSVQDNIAAVGGKTSESAGSAYDYAADGLKDLASKSQNFVGSGEKTSESFQEKIKHATEQAADILRSRGKDAASFLPNVGQGLSYAPEDKSRPGSGSKLGEYAEGARQSVGDYYESAKDKLTTSPSRESTTWREEFLNKLGIRSEEDLTNKDVLVGDFNGYYSGGAFHKAKEYLGSAASSAQDTANMVGEKARRTKDYAVDRMKHAAGRIYDSTQVSGDNLTQGAAESLDTLKSRSSGMWKNMSWATAAAWLLSSLRAVYLFCFSSVYGSSLWVTFVSGYLLSRTIPRQQFGFVQSRIFPTYLKLIAAGQAACLILYMILHPWSKADSGEKLQYLNLWGILLSTLANVFFLEPRATKVMFEKLKLEKEEGRGHENIREAAETTSLDDETRTRVAKVNHDFHVLHGYSSVANLASMIGMTWHLWHLSRRLVM